MKNVLKTIMLCILICFLGAGCVSYTIGDGLFALKGEPLNTAIDWMGVPDKQKVVNGRTFYIWSTAYMHTSVMPVSSYHTNGSYSEKTTSYVPYTNTYFCKITLEVNKDNIIINSEIYGNDEGCSKYDNLITFYKQKLERARGIARNYFKNSSEKVKGTNINHLIETLGPPTAQKEKKGNKVYTWKYSRCSLFVITNATGIILNDYYKGEILLCPYEFGMQRRINKKS